MTFFFFFPCHQSLQCLSCQTCSRPNKKKKTIFLKLCVSLVIKSPKVESVLKQSHDYGQMKGLSYESVRFGDLNFTEVTGCPLDFTNGRSISHSDQSRLRYKTCGLEFGASSVMIRTRTKMEALDTKAWIYNMCTIQMMHHST